MGFGLIDLILAPKIDISLFSVTTFDFVPACNYLIQAFNVLSNSDSGIVTDNAGKTLFPICMLSSERTIGIWAFVKVNGAKARKTIRVTFDYIAISLFL
jgi:hypothetical protein